MQKLKVGKSYKIHSYKHNGLIYKEWDHAVFLDYLKKEDVYVFANESATVLEKDGRVWNTKEPAILFFFGKHWYNVIGQLKSKGITYYCNIASPVLIEEDTIKYIDYDLDIKVFKDGGFKLLDRKEYNYHKKKMQYSKELEKIILEELSDLITKIKNKSDCFSKETINNYYCTYMKIQSDKIGGCFDK